MKMDSLSDEIIDFDGFKLRIRYEYDDTIKSVLSLGSYEGMERAALRHVLEPPDRVVEVGSAIGALALTAARIVGPDAVFTYEANPDLVDDSRYNFQLNNMSINTINAVLYPRSRPLISQCVPFYVHQQFWASSLQPQPNAVKIVSVPLRCLEDEIEAARANVLVCDIEGGELDLLSHANLTAINKIIMEVHYNAGKDATHAMIRRFMSSGFNPDFSISAYNTVVMRRS
jgi:FkbM family methyltransferase